MRKFMQKWTLVVLVLSVAACGGGGGDAAVSGGGISGVAAVGAALANASVTARCVQGDDITGTTDTAGRYTLTLDESHTAPCMLRVVGGSPSVTLYSYAASAGTVNTSPLTDWVVSKALGSDPATAFASFDQSKADTLGAGLSSAKAYVRQHADAISGTTRTTDPLTGAFSVGDADDLVLDHLAAAMASAGKSLDDMRAASVQGDDLSAMVPAYVAPSGGGTGGGTTTTGVFVDRETPALGGHIPAQLVWTGSQFVGLEQSRDYHNVSATFFVWKSADGITWTRSNTNLPSHFVVLSAANGKAFYMKGGYADSPFNVYRSDDALDWTSSSATYTGFATATGVKFLNNRYFVSLDADTCAVITSTDASTWATTQLGDLALPTGYYKDSSSKFCSAPFYVNGHYAVYGGTIYLFERGNQTPPVKGLVYTSTDGLNWTANMFDLPSTSRSVSQGGRENTTIMVGDRVVLVTNDGQIGTSTDGVSFTFASPTGLSAVTSGKITSYFPDIKVDGAIAAVSREYDRTANTYTIRHFWTSNGVDYTVAPDLKLLTDPSTTASIVSVQAYSPTLKRLVRLQSVSDAAPTVQTFDFP